MPLISILKPLCGVEDGLVGNVESFCSLDYPHYELVLGVKDTLDSAYPVALAAAVLNPGRVRVVVQERTPGLNPKVNQLIGLAAAARGEILVVSDSNIRVRPGYLQEIAAHFEDQDVGCVTHAITGQGHRTLGSLLDNLHLSSSIGPGMVAAKCVAGKDLVVGKSMAMRSADMAALGGFERLKDFLAEDYAFGGLVTRELGKRVVQAHSVVVNVSQQRTVRDFHRRYLRWSVIHRTAITGPTYLAQALINPWPLTVLAVLLAPSRVTWVCAAVCLALKMTLDVGTARKLAGGVFGPDALLAVPIKDTLLFIAWANGLFSRTVVWRGNRLRVLEGSRLVPHTEEMVTPKAAGLA